MEIMMCFDPGGLDQAEIMTAEGYHRKPTAKLQKVHAELNQLLSDNFPHRITANIW